MWNVLYGFPCDRIGWVIRGWRKNMDQSRYGSLVDTVVNLGSYRLPKTFVG